MTDKKDPHAELMRLADRFATTKPGGLAVARRDALDAYARTLTDRITELEAQLEAVGAEGVGAMLPRHAQPAPAVVGPVALVSTLLLEAEKFWWNDGPEGKTADDMNAAKDAVLRALAAPQLHQIAEPASQHTAAIALLQQAFDALEATADSDLDYFEDEEEEAEAVPAQYACRKIMQAMQIIAPTKEPS